jgi:LmbE family N-acetylglucosaminyl deacetylase
MAHPDDPELWAGGTLALHARDAPVTLAGPVSAPVIIDITSTWEQKRRALAAHAGTQPIENHFGPMADTLSRLWGARVGVPRAEAFTPVPVLGPCRPPRGSEPVPGRPLN